MDGLARQDESAELAHVVGEAELTLVKDDFGMVTRRADICQVQLAVMTATDAVLDPPIYRPLEQISSASIRMQDEKHPIVLILDERN